jgi:hypothetical protein
MTRLSANERLATTTKNVLGADVREGARGGVCFGNPTRMKRAFQRELGMGPREYAVLHPLAR